MATRGLGVGGPGQGERLLLGDRSSAALALVEGAGLGSFESWTAWVLEL